jgi:hypothetical protein
MAYNVFTTLQYHSIQIKQFAEWWNEEKKKPSHPPLPEIFSDSI